MIEKLNIIKGIHPGIFLENELKKRKLSKGRFAIAIGEYPQTLGTITKGKRGMNTVLALKIENALGWEEGFLMTLQVHYEIKEEKKKIPQLTPDLTKIRRVVFWDTTFDRIDWEKHKKFVIKRIFERGDEKEQKEIIRFYGKETVDAILKQHA